MQGFLVTAIVMIGLYLLLLMGEGNINQTLDGIEYKLDTGQFTQFNDKPSRYYTIGDQTIDRCGVLGTQAECDILLNAISVPLDYLPTPGPILDYK